MQDRPDTHHGLARQALLDFPRLDRLASETLSGWLSEHGIQDSPLQIDVVTFHYQAHPLEQGGIRIDATISQKMNLVEALLANWQGEPASGYGGFHYGDWAGLPPSASLNLVDRLQPVGVFSNANPYLVFNGLYRRQQPARYAEDTRLALRAEDFQSFIWSLHFHARFQTLLDAYWQKRQQHYQRALKIAFIAACNKQAEQGGLNPASREMIWQAAGLLPRRDVTVCTLNIYGYSSTMIVQITHSTTGMVVLYLPGNTMPFHLFDDRAALQRWFALQCQEADKRDALLMYFERADWPDGLDFSGLRTALAGLGLYPRPHRLPVAHPGFATSGVWDPSAIVDYQPATYSPPITGDLFKYLTQRQKRRTYADTDLQVTSNADIYKARWSHYLSIATALLLPLASVVPELVPLVIAGGLSQFSLGLDQAINGKSLARKEQGVSDQAFGLFNAVPAVGELVAQPEAVFSYARPGFFSPSRLTELLGSSVGTAPAVPELELEPAELAFEDRVTISTDATAAVVTRVDDHLRHRFAAWLRMGDQVVNEWVEYEFASDSFVRTVDARMAAPPRWEVSGDGPFGLVRAERTRLADNPQRMATLRALGIDVQLPIDYDIFHDLERTAIPKIVSSIWLGDQPLHGEFLQTLLHNARALRGSGYRFQVFLSRQKESAYQANLTLLQGEADAMQVLPLEEQPVFDTFRRSAYFAQYQAALDGNGGVARNLSSACDILRYRVLEQHGGLYLDADDKLVLATGTQTQLPLQRLQLKTTRNGLVLSPPVSNEQLGMYIKYNSSMIGSHPGNPTLNAVSDEILRRYGLAPTFYDSRPDPLREPHRFLRYARELNMLTGPGVLNDVIDAQVPWLKQLRELCNLLVAPLYDVHATLNLNLFNAVLREHAPLDQAIQMGQAHSWAEPAQHA